MHEIGEIPPRELALPLLANFISIVFAKKLHAHHSENENDNTKDEGQVGQRSYSVSHDCQDVIERFPRFGQFEYTEQAKGAEHGQALHALGEQFH